MNNKFSLLKYKPILEPNHLDPKLLKEKFPFVIVLGCDLVEVHLTIELNPEAFRGTIKVEDVFSDTVLTPELASVESGVLDEIPERGLGGC